MEPLTIATTFATIVSLIGQFKNENKTAEKQDYTEFKEWLEHSNHKETLTFIEANHYAIEGIKEILSEDKEIILNKLQSIDQAIASFASVFSGFEKIVDAVNPDLIISDQAINLLKEFEASGGSTILEMEMNNVGLHLQIVDSPSQHVISVAEPRFIESDLEDLLNLRLLSHKYNSNGRNMYVYTRKADRFIKSINKENS